MTVKRTVEAISPPTFTTRNSGKLHTLEELLFQLGLGNLNLNGLVHLLCVAAPMVCVVLDGGREEGVDKGRLPQA